jgi:predicted enzyme related to lactoylglutathione lyase
VTASAGFDITRFKESPVPRDIGLLVYPVNDLAHATALFANLLDAEPYVDEPYYVGFRVGNQEIGLDPNGRARGLTGPIVYWRVSDIQTGLQALLAAGAEAGEGVRDVGGGKLVATVRDASGNTIGLMQSP